MRERPALQGMAWIFGITAGVELLTVAMGGNISKILFRFLVLTILFAFLLKGYGFARYVLGVLYFAGGLYALFAGLSNASNSIVLLVAIPFGLGSLAAAWFFFRSRALRAWTGSA